MRPAIVILITLLLATPIALAVLYSSIIFQASTHCPENAKYCKLEIYKNNKFFGSKIISKGADVDLVLKAFYATTTTTTTSTTSTTTTSTTTSTTTTTICIGGTCFSGCTIIIGYDEDGTPIGMEVPC